MATKTAKATEQIQAINYLLKGHGVSDVEFPFANDSFLHSVVYGFRNPFFAETTDREDSLVMDAVPSGEEAKRLREAAGITVEKLTKVLRVGRGVIPSYEEGLSVLVDDILSDEYGHLAGPLRLYGCIDAWLKAKADSGETAAA